MPFRLKRAAVSAVLAFALTGCIFAPSKYGSSGVVLPDSAQFSNYLASCCKRYSLLAEKCESWGTPSAIQIGNSGGYFVWRNRQEWVKVKSFSARVVVGRHPRGLVYYATGETAAQQKERERAQRRSRTAAVSQGGYTIEQFERTADDEFAYAFRLRMKDDADLGLSAMGAVKRDLRQSVYDDYVATYGGTGSDIRVDFPEFAMRGSIVEGRAEVMRISVISLQYDASTQKGVIAVKIGANRFEDARKWVRKNIETLAQDKNIALTTGQIPPEARFYLGAERVRDGNILEIEFETE